MGSSSARKKIRVGYDYVHSVVDDHSRFAHSEILDDEKAATTAAFFARALTRFAAHGIAALNFGPGDPQLAHTAEERVDRAEIEGCANVLGAFVGVKD